MSPPSARHDVIVIGASTGGVQALRQLLHDLPADLPATVLIVLHIGRMQTELAAILDRAGPLPVAQAVSGDPLAPGRVHVAAPDRHLLVHDGHLLLRRGPHENMSRPAIDPLFRSAACSRDGRVIGVVLSGVLNDGTAGLRAIKRCGGLAVVQDPADAVAPDMPRSALRHVSVDHVVPIAAMGALLGRLAGTPVGRQPDPTPANICLEAAIAAQDLQDMGGQKQLGDLAPFSCPDCGGALWEVAGGSLLRYRCHVGHAYTADAMLSAQADEVDGLLNRLLRTHRERAELTRRMAERERAGQNGALARELEARARAYDENAALMEKLLSERNGSTS